MENGAENSDWPESLLKDFKIGLMIGNGAYSTVWKAVHIPSGKQVAIKRERRIFSCLDDCKYMLREIRLLRALRHRNIVRLFDLRAPKRPDWSTLFLILEFARTDLRAVTTGRSYPPTEERIKAILYDILKAIKYLHSAGVLHRDIKPQNVLLSSAGEASLCDFGLARSVGPLLLPTPYIKKRKRSEEAAPEPPSVAGSSGVEEMEVEETKGEVTVTVMVRDLTEHVVTRWYRAPEVLLLGTEYGPGIDIWATGCVFAELLSLLPGNFTPDGKKSVLFPGEYSRQSPRELEGSTGAANAKDQLSVILNVIGTPTPAEYEFITDAEKRKALLSLPTRTRKDLAEIYPAAGKDALDLLSRMLLFNPYQRLTAEQCINHPYFHGLRKPETETTAEAIVELPFEHEHLPTLTAGRLRELLEEDLDYFEQVRKAGHMTYQ